MIVNVHIERLVMHGLPVGSHETSLMRMALAVELRQLIAREGLAEGLANREFAPVISTAPITQRPRDAVYLGTQIGQAVHGVIGR